jgi:hypothetical protein
MSYQAVNWALAQDVRHSAAKFLLVVMAHHADNNTWESFLAVKSMAACTGQDRKTVIVNIARLIEGGFITDTKKRVGETGQIPVYLLNGTKNGTVSSGEDGGESVISGQKNSTEIGTTKEAEQSQKRDSLESDNSTVFPSNSTVFPPEQSQFSLETVPNLGHGIEHLIEKQKKEKKNKGAVEIPDWVPLEAWGAFVEMRQRIKKPLTEYAKKLAIDELKNLVDQGQEAKAVINQSVLKSWQGFFAVKAAANGKVSRHGGFGNQDYREGVGDDGSF